MKTIDTLVDDIYSLFDQGHDCSDENADKLGKEIATVIKDRLSSYSKERESYLRFSNLGKKDRQLFYELNDYPKETLPAPTKIKFLFGDILESMLLFLSAEAGHKVDGLQGKIEIDGVKGSRDAVIDGVTVDVKSASSYSFKKFQDGSLVDNDPFGYIYQLASYVQGDDNTNNEEGAFLVIDKQNGFITLSKVFEMDMPDVPTRIKEIREVLKKDTPPERCYEAIPEGKSGNMKLSIGCSYCAFKTECWKDVNDGKGLRTFQYSTGRTYLTEVVKEPKVQEITNA